jgi:hypothetical protein
VSIRLLNRHTRNQSRSCISRSTSQSHSLSDSISQRASLFTYHLVHTGYSPVPLSRNTPIAPKTLSSSLTDYVSSGSGSVLRTDIYAELATAPNPLTSSRTCHRHVTSGALYSLPLSSYSARSAANLGSSSSNVASSHCFQFNLSCKFPISRNHENFTHVFQIH